MNPTTKKQAHDAVKKLRTEQGHLTRKRLTPEARALADALIDNLVGEILKAVRDRSDAEQANG